MSKKKQQQLIDNIIEQEIYFENEKIEKDDEDREKFLALLLFITESLRSGKTIKQVRKHVREKDFDKTLQKDLYNFIDGQYSIITGKKGFDAGGETIIYDGKAYTFAEAVRDRKAGNQKRIISFIAGVDNILRRSVDLNARDRDKLISELIRNTARKHENSRDQFFRTQASSGRQQAYSYVDKMEDREIRGWLSVAILDNITSDLCISLHNMFYSAEDYTMRDEIPYLPPRHLWCRSIIATLYRFTGEKDYNPKDLGINTQEFLERNPDIVRRFFNRNLFDYSDYEKSVRAAKRAGRKFFFHSLIAKDRKNWLSNAQIREILGRRKKVT